MIELLKRWGKKKKVPLKNRKEICISGSGGQGIILMGIILAEAASLYEGKNATQTQVYGPESRGGASRCEIIISEGEIFYPKVTALDILLTLTQEALDKNIERLKKDGILIYDTGMIRNVPIGSYKKYHLPFTQIAIHQLENILTANMIVLGALCAVSDVVNLESVKLSLENHVKEKYKALNKKALLIGFEEGKKLIKK